MPVPQRVCFFVVVCSHLEQARCLFHKESVFLWDAHLARSRGSPEYGCSVSGDRPHHSLLQLKQESFVETRAEFHLQLCDRSNRDATSGYSHLDNICSTCAHRQLPINSLTEKRF